MTKVVGPEKGHAKERERDVTKHVKKYLLSVQDNGVKSTMTEKWQGKRIKCCSDISEMKELRTLDRKKDEISRTEL